MRRLRADLESGKEDLQRTHTELAAVQAEANRFSLALTGVKQDLEREGRTCKTLEVEVKELRGEPQASTRGLTGVQCVYIVAEERAAMECHKKSRGRSRLWPNGLKKNEAAGYGQADCR